MQTDNKIEVSKILNKKLKKKSQKTLISLQKKKIGQKKRRHSLARLKYDEKILQIKRVTKVVKGGKKLTFRAVVIVGDSKKKVGVGLGKGSDVNLALEKAVLNAKKNLINVPLTVSSSIPNVVEASYGASRIVLRPASGGTGVIAGGSVRTVLELAGIKNIIGKQLGSKNLLNNAKATIFALSFLSEKIEVAKYQSTIRKKFYSRVMKKLKKKKIQPKKFKSKIFQKKKFQRKT